jgi:acetolactate synthase I/II/III large subunit
MSAFSGRAAADAICATFARLGAPAAFGLPGGPNHVLFQALRTSATRLLVPTHELAAAFMAGAFGRIDGRPGILLTIPGPGFAYALPGVAEAWLDSAPLLHLVSAPAAREPLRLTHQGLDQRALARPITKAMFGIAAPERIDHVLGAAWETARAGEPGPVLVQLGTEAEVNAARPGSPDAAAARAVWAALQAARRPVLLVGQGCAGATAAVRAYVERTGTPAFTTPSGRGILAEDSPWCVPYDTLRENTAAMNALLARADAILVLGARLAHNGTSGFALQLPREHLLHVDANPANLNAFYPARLTAAADAASFLAMPEAAAAPRSAWTAEEIRPWREQVRRAESFGAEPLYAGRAAAEFFAALRRALPDEALVVTDSGLHQVLARRYYEVRAPHGLLLPTDLQAMGFGLPASIAACLAAPARRVVALLGDGGALMSALELAIAVRERVALTAIVFNDGYLNQIRLQQLADSGRSHGVTLPQVDFAALAAAVGADYLLADTGLECLGQVGERRVTLIEVPVSDGSALVSAAARNRVRRLAAEALGPRWRRRVRGWLGRA